MYFDLMKATHNMRYVHRIAKPTKTVYSYNDDDYDEIKALTKNLTSYYFIWLGKKLYRISGIKLIS